MYNRQPPQLGQLPIVQSLRIPYPNYACIPAPVACIVDPLNRDSGTLKSPLLRGLIVGVIQLHLNNFMEQNPWIQCRIIVLTTELAMPLWYYTRTGCSDYTDKFRSDNNVSLFKIDVFFNIYACNLFHPLQSADSQPSEA